MSLRPMDQDIWAHAGSRMPAGIEPVFKQVPGAFLQAPLSTSRTRALMDSALPTALQHDGGPIEPTLFTREEDWYYRQHGAAVYTSHVNYIGMADGRAVGARAAVETMNLFLQFVGSAEPNATCMGVVAIDARLLRSDPTRSELVAALSTVEGPFGLMLGGNRRDPLDDVRIVEGLVRLVTALPAVAVLRCDHGALGAFAFGAVAGSIGITAGARHFTLPGERAFADVEDKSPRVYWPFAQTWRKGSLFAQMGPIDLLRCFCTVCQGKSLSRFHSQETTIEAAKHSVACWRSTAVDLRAKSGSARQDEWIKLCALAYANLDILEADQQLLFPPSKQLKAWLRFAGVPAI